MNSLQSKIHKNWAENRKCELERQQWQQSQLFSRQSRIITAETIAINIRAFTFNRCNFIYRSISRFSQAFVSEQDKARQQTFCIHHFPTLLGLITNYEERRMTEHFVQLLRRPSDFWSNDKIPDTNSSIQLTFLFMSSSVLDNIIFLSLSSSVIPK